MVITLSKIVRKLRPVDYWKIGENESWFQDMALKGLHLKKGGKLIATFEKDEPEDIRYRIDIYQGENTDKEQKEFYAESGWDFVTDYNEFNVYKSPTKLNAPEIHTDPIEQAYTLKTIENKIVGLLGIFIIAPITFLIMLYLMIFKDSTFSYGILDGGSLLIPLILLVGLRGLYDNGRSFLEIRKLRTELIEGKQINHKAPWRKRNQFNRIISYILLGIIVTFYIMSSKSIGYRNTIKLEDSKTNLPIVRLANIEQSPNFTITEKGSRKWYYSKWNIFASIYYETYEDGEIKGEFWDDDSPRYGWKEKSEVYTPSIMTETYKLITPKMSPGVFKGLIKDTIDNEFEHIKVENSDFEMIEVYKSTRFIHVFAYKGKGVISVRYSGKADHAR